MSAPGRHRSAVVVNGFADTNLGGAAITLATCDLVRDLGPDVSVSMVTVDHGADLRFNRVAQPDLVVLDPPFDLRGSRASRLVATLRSVVALLVPAAAPRSATTAALRSADVVVSKGGFVYRERHGAGSLLAGWFTMWPYMFARRCGAASVAWSVSVGPFESAPSRWLSRRALRGSDVLCPRDAASLERLGSDLGLRDGVVPTSDCVLGMLDDERVVSPPLERDGSVVTVVPRGVPEPAWPGFVACVRRAVDAAGADRVEMALQADADLPAARRLAAQLGLDADVVVPTATSLESTAMFRRSGLVVTGRLHGAILGLLSRTPVMMIEIPDEVGKSDPVLDDLGLRWIVVATDADGDTVDDVVARLLAPEFPEQLEPALVRVAARVRSARAEAVDRLRTRLR